jgi:hypothetical protein
VGARRSDLLLRETSFLEITMALEGKEGRRVVSFR